MDKTDTLQDDKFMFGKQEITCRYCKKALPKKFCKRHSPRTSITHRVYSATPTPQLAEFRDEGVKIATDMSYEANLFYLESIFPEQPKTLLAGIARVFHESHSEVLKAATERAEVEGATKELAALHSSEIANQSLKKMQTRIKGRLRTLTTLDKEKTK